MKIENKIVSIRIGKRQYDLKNLITNAYLNKFAKSQLNVENFSSRDNYLGLTYCLLKFDTSLNITDDVELHNQDFDICFVGGVSKVEQSISNSSIAVKYNYFTEFTIYDYQKGTTANLTNYVGKKITAIGFNVHWMNDTNLETKLPILAVIDVSNYNIYLQENQNLSITRQDIITSDAEFYCDNAKVKGPLHLAPFGGEQIIEQEPYLTDEGHYFNYDYEYSNTNLSTKGSLYSIGLSSSTSRMDKEFIIGNDTDSAINADAVNNKIVFDQIENYFSKYYLHPSNNVYPSSSLYPCKKTDYKYIVFKYKVFQIMGDYQKTRK